jgi:hypothetical protein
MEAERASETLFSKKKHLTMDTVQKQDSSKGFKGLNNDNSNNFYLHNRKILVGDRFSKSLLDCR